MGLRVHNNLLYIIFEELDINSGIGNKIRAQIRAFERLGYNVSLIYLKKNSKGCYESINDDCGVIKKFFFESNLLCQIEWRLRYGSVLDYILLKSIKKIYIRYTHFSNPFFINFLKKLYALNINVVIEIPTFPYDGEYLKASFKLKFLHLIERCTRRYMKNYIDAFINYSNKEVIFGGNTICLHNGVDLDEISVKKNSDYSKCVHLVATASMAPWHGYERIIKGLYQYYLKDREIEVYFHLIGISENITSKKYINLIHEYNLAHYIKTYPFMSGKDLDDIFDRSHIGIGCLGLHRNRREVSKTLKNAEYCARGIPFVYSGVDEVFDSENFVYKIDSNEAPVDILNIVQFLKDLTVDAMAIRSFAKMNLTWEIQLKKLDQAVLKI